MSKSQEGTAVEEDPVSAGSGDEGEGERVTWLGAGPRRAEPSLLDDQLEKLAVTEQLATWKAFAAPLAADSGAVIEDPELVQLAVSILAVYANHQSRSGLTFAQLNE